MDTTALTQPTARRVGGLAADDYGRDDDRAPLVLLHGMTFDRTIWSGLIADLQAIDAGRRVLAIDLPGHGQSPEQPSYELADVAEQFHRAIVEAGLEAPVVVGHSAGALAATVYAAQHPTRGVVNVDQPLQIRAFAELVRSVAPQLRGPAFPDVWQMFYDGFRTDLLPPAARELVRSTCRPRPRVMLGFWRQLIERPIEETTPLIDDALAALRKSAVPYLHIAGEEPGTDYRHWLGQRLPAATIDVWPQSGHFPHLASPDRFAQRLGEHCTVARELERADRMTRRSRGPAIAAAIALVWLTAACASHSTARRPPAADTGAAARKQVNTSSLRPAPTSTDHANGSGLKPTCQVLAANLDFLEQATSGSAPDLRGAIARMRSLERSAPVEIQPDVKVIADFDQHVLDAVSTGGSAGDIRETPQLTAALSHEAAWVTKHCR